MKYRMKDDEVVKDSGSTNYIVVYFRLRSVSWCIELGVLLSRCLCLCLTLGVYLSIRVLPWTKSVSLFCAIVRSLVYLPSVRL